MIKRNFAAVEYLNNGAVKCKVAQRTLIIVQKIKL